MPIFSLKGINLMSDLPPAKKRILKPYEIAYRSHRWRKARAKHLHKHNACVVCGTRERLEVDHRIPVSKGGDMWDERNYTTLCIVHHSQKTSIDTGRTRLRSVDDEGYPIDTAHEWNK